MTTSDNTFAATPWGDVAARSNVLLEKLKNQRYLTTPEVLELQKGVQDLHNGFRHLMTVTGNVFIHLGNVVQEVHEGITEFDPSVVDAEPIVVPNDISEIAEIVSVDEALVFLDTPDFVSNDGTVYEIKTGKLVEADDNAHPIDMSVDEDSNLFKHARRELALIGEEPEIVEMYIRVIKAFMTYGHSGGSASVAIPVINELLRHKPLSLLTANPGEWMNVSEASGTQMWQNVRSPSVFSKDGGQTYYDLDDEDREIHESRQRP